MAYQTGTATGPEDLLDSLLTFASSNGWTVDRATDGSTAFIHKNSIYVGFYYTTSLIKIYPARGYTNSSPQTAPGEHPNSAYNDNLTFTTQGMRVNAITGPFDAYWFFEDDNYLHIVLNINTGLHRHFGFGEMIKTGSFNGGEYYYCHYWDQAAANIDVYTSVAHSPPFDSSIHSGTDFTGVYVYGRKSTSPETALDGAPAAAAKWYIDSGGGSMNDGDGVTLGRLMTCGLRGGIYSSLLSVGQSSLNGYTPLLPCHIFLKDTSAAPDAYYLMGAPPDLRAVNIAGYADGQEVTIGSDTWVVFPLGRSTDLGTDTEYTRTFGFAYKKVVA